ncbi:MAG: AarF/ABC1/UbiB kinase family protein [Thermoleophilia bacterium]|nr:AarF/ABC1/UbiB kinase family protein [Thermoleophilia bacterium]
METARPQRKIGRLSEIGRVATRHGFGYLIDRRRGNDNTQLADRGRRLREMLDELGPTFVKFGQLLSTRPDVMPPDIVVELRSLQDDVAPVDFSEIRRVIEEEVGLTIEQAFLDFDEVPLAAASIGQVHRATLPTGEAVVVKVQRPEAPRQVESDLELMRSAARVIRDRVHALDFIDAEALVEEFARSIRQELDYNHEARNAETFRRNFGGSTEVVVPKVIWRYSSARVLTLEYLEGAQFADLDLESRSLEERREIAYRMTDAWMTMIFRHGFFHGDPHPANILLLDDGRIGLVDFGLAGRLTNEDMTHLTRLFIDAATENVAALPRHLADLGLSYPKDREDEFREALEELFYRYHGSRVSDIDPVEVIREALDLVYSLNLRLPSRFVTLDKAVATLGAVGVELYPDFNVFEVARPYARQLIAERFSPRRISLRAQAEVRDLAAVARELPSQIRDVMEQTRQGQLTVQIRNPGLDDISYHIHHAVNRLAVALIVLGGLVGSAILGVLATGGPHVVGLHIVSFLGFIISGAFAVWLVWGIARSGRL